MMKFTEFMKTFGYWEDARDQYITNDFPLTIELYNELNEAQIDYLLTTKHTEQRGNLKRALISEKGESLVSRSFILFWLFKALEECGAYPTEGYCEIIGLTFETMGGLFYVDLHATENGIKYETWVSYDEELLQKKKKEIRENEKMSELEKCLKVMLLTPEVERIEGFLSVDDFLFEADDVFDSIRKQMYEFSKREK
jgi:hypothetical protein